MWTWMEQYNGGIDGYERRLPSKLVFSRNTKRLTQMMELVGERSEVGSLKLEPILSNYPAITEFIKDKLNSERDLEYNICIYYDYNYVVPVVFSDSDKWKLEEEMWSLDSRIIRMNEIKEFLKCFTTSTRSSKKVQLGKRTALHGFESDPVLSSFPNIARVFEDLIHGTISHDCYIYLYFDFGDQIEYWDTETFKLAAELISLREKCLHSVSTLNHHWYGNVRVLLTRLLIRLLQVCNSMTILPMLMLIVVSPVKTDSLFDWKNTTNPVISTMRQRIALEWKYISKQPVNSMVFTRFRKSSDPKVPVGKWTKDGGFKPDPFISTELTLIAVDKNKTNEKKVSLILENPIHIDYDLLYNCQVNFGDQVPGNNLSIGLRALRPIWTRTEVEKHATLGKDVIFRWEYKYPFKAIAVFIRRENNSEMVEVGYWYQGDFTDLGQFINRVVVTKTPYKNQTGEKIRFTLQNVSVEDYGWEYVCQLTLGDGEQLLTRTVLKEADVKPNTVTPRTDSRTSAASRSPVGYSTIILLVIVTSIISHISQD